jgi:hypothetical protein
MIRDLEAGYNEEMSEVPLANLAYSNITTGPVATGLKQVVCIVCKTASVV